MSSLPPSPTSSPVPLGAASVDGCRLPLGAHVVLVPTADGLRLTGIALGAGTRGVALFHSSDGDLCQWAEYAWRLAGVGMQVLAIDARGHGSTVDPSSSAPTSRYDLDGVAALTWLLGHGVVKAGLAGASIGGTLALATAERPGAPVVAVASLSGPQKDFGRLDAFAGRARLPSAVLLIVGGLDGTFAKDADVLAANIQGARLIKADAGEHGTALLPKVVDGLAIEDSLTAFFVRSLA
ncbi:MAG: alpha/beta fold hydrolase [Pseudonocardiales bacterium]